MRKLKFSFSTELWFDSPVDKHYYTLRCIPSSDGVQQVFSVKCMVAPGENIRYNRDGFCNRTGIGCIQQAHRYFSFKVEGLAFVTKGYRVFDEAGGSNAVFRYPTALTMPDEGIKAFAGECIEMKGQSADTVYLKGQNAGFICKDILQDEQGVSFLFVLNKVLHDYMSYTRGATTVGTTAAEAFAKRAGVCQDYAHIFIAMARYLGYPARYVSGLIPGEGATHAWAEVAVGKSWVGFDPANCCMADDGYIKFAHGRDYADCPIERGVFCGSAAQKQSVQVSVRDV